MATYLDWLNTYNSYAGTDIVVTAQLSNKGEKALISKCYVLGSLQTISISTHQDKRPVRAIGNINAIDYVMGQRTIAGSLVFAVFDRHFADEIFNDLKTYTKDTVILTDEIPPLDLTISFANEYGKKSKMTLYGVRMINEGQVMSINDLYTENTYQFVALGMEPLTCEDENYTDAQSNEKPTNPDTTNKDYYKPNREITPVKLIPPTVNKPVSGEELGNIIEHDNYKKEDPKLPYYEINQPIVEGGEGILNIFNKDKDTNIYVTDKENNNLIELNKYKFNDNNWYSLLPEGEYILHYSNDKGEVGSSNFAIKYNDVYKDKNNYPLINNISSDSIEVESNEPNHDYVTVKELAKPKSYIIDTNDVVNEKSVKLDKNKAIITDLNPDTYYVVYTTNGLSKSKQHIVSTLKEDDDQISLFIDYLKNNNKLLVNKFSTLDIEDLYKSNTNNVIDNILTLDNSKAKEEMLLYAIKFQNDFINSINNPEIKKIKNKNLLNVTIENNNDNLKYTVYECKNNKYYFDYSTDNKDDILLSGKTNSKYVIQPIDSDNLKGTKYDFTYFSSETKKDLKCYFNLDNLKKVDISRYKERYPNYDTEFLKSIIAKDKNIPDYYLLEEPYGYYLNDLLIVDVNYKDYLQDKNYYLCISLVDEVLDYLPVNKIKFTKNDTTLVLKNYESLVLKDNYYLLWIEDENYNKISNSQILSTYTNTLYIDNYYSNLLKSFLNSKCKELESIFSYKSLFDTIYLSILSYSPAPKNWNHVLEQEILTQGYNSDYSNMLDMLMYNTIALNFTNIKNMCSNFTVENNLGHFTDTENCKLITIDYYLDKDMPEINSFKSDSKISLNNKDSYYTLIYLVEDNMFNKSGFILKNNISNKIYNLDIDVEVK